VEENRSRFVLDAVKQELRRRRRAELKRSLRNPHPDTAQLVETGFDEWAAALPDEDATGLVDLKAGTPVRWVAGRGWVETKK